MGSSSRSTTKASVASSPMKNHMQVYMKSHGQDTSQPLVVFRLYPHRIVIKDLLDILDVLPMKMYALCTRTENEQQRLLPELTIQGLEDFSFFIPACTMQYQNHTNISMFIPCMAICNPIHISINPIMPVPLPARPTLAAKLMKVRQHASNACRLLTSPVLNAMGLEWMGMDGRQGVHKCFSLDSAQITTVCNLGSRICLLPPRTLYFCKCQLCMRLHKRSPALEKKQSA